MDLAAESWRWIWLTAAVVFAVGEIAVAGSFFMAPFAIAATAAFVVAYAGAPVTASWLVFLGVSVVASLALRPLARRLDASSPPSNVGAHRWAGRAGVVLEDIPGGLAETGMVRVEREEWRAQSEDGSPIPAGTRITVSRVDGTRLVVREERTTAGRA